MRTDDRWLYISGHVSSDTDFCGVVIVTDVHMVVGNVGIVDVHSCDVVHLERTSEDGQYRSAVIIHFACLCCWKSVGDIAHDDVQRLCLCRDCQHKCCQKMIYSIHFTAVLKVLLLVFTM